MADPTHRIAFIVGPLTFFVLLIAALPALAHATLVSSAPKDGAVISAAPSEIILTFNESVQPTVLRLVDPQGGTTQLTSQAIRGSAITVALPQQLRRGTHALSWRVISTDGHPLGGSIVFAIGSPSGSYGSTLNQDSDRTVHVAVWLCRIGLFLGLFVGVGGSIFAVLMGSGFVVPAAALQVINWSISLGLLAALISLGLQGLDVLELPISHLLRVETWIAGYATTYGVVAPIAVIALLAAYGSLQSREWRMKVLLSACATVLLGASFLAAGHVSTAEPLLLSRPALFLHVASIAFWIGALVPLFFLLRSGDFKTGPSLERFTQVIPLPLATLVVSGVILVIIQLDRINSLWLTNYGQILCMKLIALVGLFAVAAINRYKLTPAFRNGAATAPLQLSSMIKVELTLVMLVFASVASWRFTPPPRILVYAETAASTHIRTDRAVADVMVAREHAGSQVKIVLQTADFRPLTAKEVTLTMSNPSLGVEPFTRSARPASDERTWYADGLILPAIEIWTVDLEVFITDFDKIELSGEIELRHD